MATDELVLAPEDLLFDCAIFAMEFHPGQDQIAVGLVDGTISLWNYGIEENQKILHKRFHKKACRTVRFSADGQRIHQYCHLLFV
jgi:WD40 repeat protein